MIASRYADLDTLTRSPVVTLNRAVAVAEVEGPLAGLAVIDGLDEALPNNHRLHAVRADLARRASKTKLARSSYIAALELCANKMERKYLTRRLDALDPPDA